MTLERAVSLLRNNMKLVVLGERAWIVENTAPSTTHGGYFPELLEELLPLCDRTEELCLARGAAFGTWVPATVYRLKKGTAS